MKVLVLGASGMLGSEVLLTCAQAKQYSVYGVPPSTDLTIPEVLHEVVNEREYDCIINCAGSIPSKAYTESYMIRVNSYLPHLLAEAFRGQIIHISTDCVFNGLSRSSSHWHMIAEAPSPMDVYGRSKLLGECHDLSVCNVRCSFIGKQHGLLAWALSNQGKGNQISGWKEAYWNGSTVQQVAQVVVGLVDKNPPNVLHLADSTRYSKYDVLRMINKVFDLDLHIQPVDTPIINRTLQPSMGFQVSLEEALETYKEERCLVTTH